MAYDISGMAAWSKSEGKVLIEDLILGGQSFSQKGIVIQSGIKSTDKLVDFSVGTTYLQTTNGDAGALSYSGGSTLDDIDISVVEISVKERYVTGTLVAKIAQMQMQAGSDPSQALPFNDVLVALKQKQVGKMNDILLWVGDDSTGNTNANTNKFDGWLVQFTGGSCVSGGSATALAASTAIASVEAVHNIAITSFPEWVDESYMFMSPKNFSTYYRAVFGLATVIDALTFANTMPLSFLIPGTNTLVQSAQGLTGYDNIIETRYGNLVIGNDLESETESLTLEYLNESLCWRLLAIYKLGCKVARPKEGVVTL